MSNHTRTHLMRTTSLARDLVLARYLGALERGDRIGIAAGEVALGLISKRARALSAKVAA